MKLTSTMVLRKIEVADSLEYLKTLEGEIEIERFTEQEQETIHEALQNKERDIIGETKKRLVAQERTDLPFKASLYDRDDSSFLPSFTTLYEKGMDYLSFLREIYFKEFVKLPDEDIQVPVLISSFFLNSMAIPNRCRLPLIYLYSPKENSGKSTLMFHFGHHYHPKFKLYFGVEVTGAGLRNNLHPIAVLDQPCLVMLDNYHSEETKKKLGATGWAIMLKYTREEAQRNIIGNVDGEYDEFNSHALKVVSSVTALGHSTESGSEIRSRCINFFCEPFQGLTKSVDSYNWDNCQREYFDVWGDPDKANKIYKQGILKELLQKNSKEVGIYNRQWLLSISVISVGVFAGVWTSIDAGISAMRDYWDWESGKRIVKMSPLESWITDYALRLHPKMVEDERIKKEGTLLTILLAPDFIRLSELYDYLSLVKKRKQTQTYQLDNQISQIMHSLGYGSRPELHKTTGQAVDIQYFKL